MNHPVSPIVAPIPLSTQNYRPQWSRFNKIHSCSPDALYSTPSTIKGAIEYSHIRDTGFSNRRADRLHGGLYAVQQLCQIAGGGWYFSLLGKHEPRQSHAVRVEGRVFAKTFSLQTSFCFPLHGEGSTTRLSRIRACVVRYIRSNGMPILPYLRSESDISENVLAPRNFRSMCESI